MDSRPWPRIACQSVDRIWPQSATRATRQRKQRTGSLVRTPNPLSARSTLQPIILAFQRTATRRPRQNLFRSGTRRTDYDVTGTKIPRTIATPGDPARSHGLSYRANWTPWEIIAICVYRIPPRAPINSPKAPQKHLGPPRGSPKCLNRGVPTGIRTPVSTVKGWCPRPLDDGDAVKLVPYPEFGLIPG